MKKFLNRPKPIYSESLRSYLKRLAENNFISPDTLLRALGLPREHQLTPTYLAKRYDKFAPTITSIEAVNKLEPGSLLSKIPAPQSTGEYYWYGINMPLTHLRGNSAVCKHCLTGNNIEKNVWFIRAYNFCTEHNTSVVPVDPFYEFSNRSISTGLEDIFSSQTFNSEQIEQLNNQLIQITNSLSTLKTSSKYVPLTLRHSLANHKVMMQAELFTH